MVVKLLQVFSITEMERLVLFAFRVIPDMHQCLMTRIGKCPRITNFARHAKRKNINLCFHLTTADLVA